MLLICHGDFPPRQRESKKGLGGLSGGDLGTSGKSFPHASLAESRVCSPVPAPASILVAPEKSDAPARYLSPPTSRATSLCPCPFLVSADVYSLSGAG